jgi:hypothetical protein
MLEFIKTSDLPPECKTCDDMKERAHYFTVIKYLGTDYYIPVTPHIAKFLGFPIRHGPDVGTLPRGRDSAVYRFFQDLIAAVYLQVRDTVGNEIKEELGSQISEGFEKFFSGNLSRMVDDKLNGKLLENKSGT